MEAWLDPQRLEALGQKDLLADCRAGRPIEVSVGAFVRTELRSGEHNGKKFAAIWREMTPDHLAFLPKSKGACSIEMGCGTHRAAEAYDPTECEFVLYSLQGAEPEVVGEPTAELRTAVGRRNNATDQAMIQSMHDHAVTLGAKCDRMESAMQWLQAGITTLDFRGAGPLPDKAQIKKNGKYEDCPTCDGMGQVDGKDCPTCEGSGKVGAKTRAAEWEESKHPREEDGKFGPGGGGEDSGGGGKKEEKKEVKKGGTLARAISAIFSGSKDRRKAREERREKIREGAKAWAKYERDKRDREYESSKPRGLEWFADSKIHGLTFTASESTKE